MESHVEVCRSCQGDPRAAQRCSECHGAALYYRNEVGVLLWEPTLSTTLFEQRSARRSAQRFIFGVLGIIVFLCLASAVAAYALGAWTPTTWMEVAFSEHWASLSLWTALVCGVIALAHALRLYAKRQTLEPLYLHPDATRVIDISEYFDEAAWSVVREAYLLAKEVGSAEVSVAHVFAAAISSKTGGVFMARLGTTFDALKEPLIEVLRAVSRGDEPVLSIPARTVLLSAANMSMQDHRERIGVAELFSQAFLADESLQRILNAVGFPPEHVVHVAQWIRLQEVLRDEQARFVKNAAHKPKNSMNRLMTARSTPLLDRFSEDVTLLARQGYVAPVVAREDVLEQLFRAVSAQKGGVALVGEHGVGKTAIIDALARAMVEELVPKELFDQRIVSVRLPALLAAGDPAQALQRLLSMISEARLSGNVVLVLEGAETLASGAQGSMDLAEALATEIDRGGMFVVLTTTPEAWTSGLERRSIAAKLVRIEVPELDADGAMQVLMARSGFMEYQTHVFYSYAALRKAYELGKRFMRELRMPQAALDVLKEAAVYTKETHGEWSVVSEDDIAHIIEQKTHVPVRAAATAEANTLLDLETRLQARVIGQHSAIESVARAMRRARADVRERKRPIASFLFLGPTGVGKTELAKALAAEYFGNEQNMIRLDMSEYQNQAAVERVVGAPGSTKGGLLTEAVRTKPFSIVLLDELEKAHPDLLTLFLQVMDDGRLTDGVGRTVDFTNVVLIATSNAGSTAIQERLAQGMAVDALRSTLLEGELRSTFRPEFINRFDDVIVFTPLTQTDVQAIAALLMQGLRSRMEEQGMRLEIDDEALAELAHDGFDPLYGARPLRRLVQDRVETAIADAVLRKQAVRGSTLVVHKGGVVEVQAQTL